MKLYVGDGVLDVPEGPRNEILLRNIWQGFGTVKTVPYGWGEVCGIWQGFSAP